MLWTTSPAKFMRADSLTMCVHQAHTDMGATAGRAINASLAAILNA